MIRQTTMGTAAIFCILIFGNAHAQIAAPDAPEGHELAERLCTNCHAVAPGSTSGRSDVPSFTTIAKLPGLTPERLVGAIIIPHPPMPGIPLTTSEIRDIVAYIISLRPPDTPSSR
jgi:mono/diheme cytochrome c family protein